MKLSKEDERDYNNATRCHICKDFFCDDKNYKVRDHDHSTGKYRGAAHTKCNINYFSNRYLPIVFHNLRGYDGHLIIKQCINYFDRIPNISAIPNSYEKYMSFKINNMKFIDSFQFMSSSLETLAENLYDDNDKYINFNNMKQEFNNEQLEWLCQKGYYPYEWADGYDKFKHKGLPAMECFYSKLKKEGLKAKEYEHALKVYDVMKCQTFEDYHKLYLKTDIILLSDVFENFRKCALNTTN